MKALDYALALTADGTLSIDDEGRVWRHFVRTKNGRKAIARAVMEATTKGAMQLEMVEDE